MFHIIGHSIVKLFTVVIITKCSKIVRLSLSVTDTLFLYLTLNINVLGVKQGLISPVFLVPNQSSLCAKNLILLMATAFGKNEPKYGARHKSCSLKYALKF